MRENADTTGLQPVVLQLLPRSATGLVIFLWYLRLSAVLFSSVVFLKSTELRRDQPAEQATA